MRLGFYSRVLAAGLALSCSSTITKDYDIKVSEKKGNAAVVFSGGYVYSYKIEFPEGGPEGVVEMESRGRRDENSNNIPDIDWVLADCTKEQKTPSEAGNIHSAYEKGGLFLKGGTRWMPAESEAQARCKLSQNVEYIAADAEKAIKKAVETDKK